VLLFPKIKHTLWLDYEILNQYEWAQQNDLIFDASLPSLEFLEGEKNSSLYRIAANSRELHETLSAAVFRQVRPEDDKLAALADEIRRAFDSAKGHTIDSDKHRDSEKAHDFLMNFLWVSDECLARLRAAELCKSGQLDAVSAAGTKHDDVIDYLTRKGAESSLSRYDTVKIVIDKLPLPSDSTPWEQILEFKNDPSSRQNLLLLRQWIRDVSTGNIKYFEIEEKLEFLLGEYRAHMSLHKMKTYPGSVQTLVTTTAEAIENLMKLRLSHIAKSLFEFKDKRIALLEAERKAPGREVSYLIKASKVFGDE
jgi:hypothetical protein